MDKKGEMIIMDSSISLWVTWSWDQWVSRLIYTPRPKKIIPIHILGIYRDDGLIAMEQATSYVEVEKTKQEIHKFA